MDSVIEELRAAGIEPLLTVYGSPPWANGVPESTEQLLRQQKEFEYVSLNSKLATFRKLVDGQFLPEWNGEPYIAQNSLVSPP